MIPREHGAWAMVALPFIVGAFVAHGALSFATAAAALATLAVFVLRTPLVALWRMRVNSAEAAAPLVTAATSRRTAVLSSPPPRAAERRQAMVSLLFYSAVAVLAGAYLLAVLPAMPLVVMGVAAAVLTIVSVWLVAHNYQRDAALQIASALGLTASALVGYLAAHGRLAPAAFYIWGLFAAHSGASVLVVHAQIEWIVASRKRAPGTVRPHRRNAWIAQAGLWTLLAILALRNTPWLALPFVPACLLHAASLFALQSQTPRRISLQRVGVTNLAASIVFAVILIVLLDSGRIALR